MESNSVATDISEYRIPASNLSNIQTVTYSIRDIYCMHFIQHCNSYRLYSALAIKISHS